MRRELAPMVGHLLASVVFVDGPLGTSASFTHDEKLAALRAVYSATTLLQLLGDQWGGQQQVPVRGVCRFTGTHRTVTLARDPGRLEAQPRTFELREQVWLDDATEAMGISGGTLFERFEEIRRGLWLGTFLGLGVADSFPIFISKYPVHHPAFAHGAAVILSWTEVMADEDLRGRLDGVIAHEIGHVFGADDEYRPNQPGKQACSINDEVGFFGTGNANCEVDGSVPHPTCLMSHYTRDLCSHTPLHWGWVDADQDGVPDLAAPATVQVSARTAAPGETFRIEGRNVWDARLVFFGNEVCQEPAKFPTFTPIDIGAPTGSIDVVVPPDANGIVNVNLVTRAGASNSPSEDTWVLVTSLSLPPAPGDAPIVFGIVPSSGPAGTRVTILGARIFPAQSVGFNGVPADISGLNPQDATSGDPVVPAPEGLTGPVTVTVTTDDGTSLAFEPFTTFTYP